MLDTSGKSAADFIIAQSVGDRSLRDGRLVVLLPEHRVPTHQLHAVFPSRRGLVPAVRAFIEFLAAELPAMTAGASSSYGEIVRSRQSRG